MPRIDDCISCHYYAWNNHLVCALHPTGPDDATCDDYQFNPDWKGKQSVNFVNSPEWEDYHPPTDLPLLLENLYPSSPFLVFEE